MTEVFALNIKQTKKLNDLKYLISPEKQKRLDKIKHFPSFQQILAGDILVRSVICNKLGIKNSAIMFSYNNYGKPRLNHFKDFHFNLSHSGNWVVLAVSSEEIGIDIEQVVPLDLSIAEHVFSSFEKQQLSSKSAALQLDYFFQIWTLKESYIKMKGEGLSTALNSFTIKIEEGNKYPELIKTPTEKAHFRLYELEDNYKISVCSHNNNFFPGINEISEDFLHIF